MATLLSAAVRARRLRLMPELARFGRVLDRMGPDARYLFDPSWYRSRYEDVAASGMDPLVHYVLHGGKEGRDPSPLFDTAWYVSHCPGGTGELNPLVHYVVRGAAAGCDPHPLFEGSWYRRQYEDAESPELVDFIRRGRDLQRRPNRVFDPIWYVEQEGFGEVVRSTSQAVHGADALLHYAQFGAERGWNPAPWFSTRWWAHRAGTSQGDALVNFLRMAEPGPHPVLPGLLQTSGAQAAYADSHWDPHPGAHRGTGSTLYYVEDLVPTRRAGAGYPRSVAILGELAASGMRVVVLSTCQMPTGFAWDVARADLGDEVVVIPEFNRRQVAELLRHAVLPGDMVWACRPENMSELLGHWGGWRPEQAGAALLWDAEALASSREELRAVAVGAGRRDPIAHVASPLEVTCARGANVVAAVSTSDMSALRAAGLGNVVLIGHSVEASQNAPSPEGRDRILFVGRLNEPDSPNVDSLRWYVEQVGPLLGRPALELLDAVGLTSELVASDPLLVDHLRGPQEELEGWYARARLFIAPTRFAAGVPLKVIEAAAAGVPVIATPILVQQLGWTPGVDLLVGQTPEEFAACVRELLDDDDLWQRLRRAAQLRVMAQYSPEVLRTQVATAMRRVGA